MLERKKNNNQFDWILIILRFEICPLKKFNSKNHFQGSKFEQGQMTQLTATP